MRLLTIYDLSWSRRFSRQTLNERGRSFAAATEGTITGILYLPDYSLLQWASISFINLPEAPALEAAGYYFHQELHLLGTVGSGWDG